MRANWSSSLSYVLTVAGATIGFGCTWRFPYLVGQYGGGIFLLLFIAIMFLVGIPLVMAESVIGRKAGTNTIDAFKLKHTNIYKYIGYLALFGAFGILAYYMVLGGWVINYIYHIIVGDFSLSKGVLSREFSSNFFKSSILDGLNIVLFTGIFVLMNYIILIKGIIAGVERTMKVLMPMFFIILLIIIARSVSLDGAMRGIIFYLKPDVSKLSWEALLAAVGQVFFALSIGFGVIITLSSYLSRDSNLIKTSIIAGVINTLIAFLAGFMIFPAIFAFNLSPTSGPSLVFEVLPIVFSSMFLGNIFAVLFFSLLLIAALTTSITIYEVIITTLQEKLPISRKVATSITLGGIFILGNVPSALAFSTFSDVILWGKNIFDFYDFVSANILFVLTALLSSIFVSFIIKDDAIAEITNNNKLKFAQLNIWIFFLRYIIPVVIGVIFITNL